MDSLYKDMTITEVRFRVRELFNILDELTVKQLVEKDMIRSIHKARDLAEIIDHSKWTMEKF